MIKEKGYGGADQMTGGNKNYGDSIAATILAARAASEVSAKSLLVDAQNQISNYFDKLSTSEVAKLEYEIEKVASEKGIEL